MMVFAVEAEAAMFDIALSASFAYVDRCGASVRIAARALQSSCLWMRRVQTTISPRTSVATAALLSENLSANLLWLRLPRRRVVGRREVVG